MRAPLRAALAVLFLAASAEAQAPHPGAGAGGVPDVPAGGAAIRGRVVAPGGEAGAADVEVVLYALPMGQPPGLRRTVTDAGGRFAFEGISNDARTSYLVGARKGEIPFPGERVNFAAGEDTREVEIRMAEASEDPGIVSVGDVRLRLDWLGGRLVLSETHRLRNGSERVFFVPDDARKARPPAFRTELPAGATDLTGPLGIVPEGLVREGDTLRFYGPVYPGEQDLSFSYAVPAAAGTVALEKRLAAGAAGAQLLAPESGLEVTAPGLAAAAPESLDGRSYRRFTTGAVAPGGRIRFEVTVPEAQQDPAALGVGEVRVFLEQDVAALTVREEHRLQVAGDRLLVAAPGGRLYRIALPPDARDIRFATDPPGIALVPGEDGGIEVAGPIPAGEATLELLYHVPVNGGRSEVTLQSSRAIPLLSVFVADTGLALDSLRLHRRRPVRTEDRTYLHLEAFDVEPDEKVSIAIASLERGAGLGTTASLLAALLAAGGIAFVLATPLRRSARPADAAAEEAAAERESLYAAIRDLEEDFETGKLSDGDFAALRGELRGRALALLQAERQAGAPLPETPPQPAAAACSACGRTLAPEDRFCSRCGAAVETSSTPSREASA